MLTWGTRAFRRGERTTDVYDAKLANGRARTVKRLGIPHALRRESTAQAVWWILVLTCLTSMGACSRSDAPSVSEPTPYDSGRDFALLTSNGLEVVGQTRPHGLEGLPATRYTMYRGKGFRLQLRYGPAPSQPAIHELFVAPKRPVDTVVEQTTRIDARQARIRRWRRGPPNPHIAIDIDAPGTTRGHDFNAIAHCETAAACQEAESLGRSIRFLR